MRFFKHLKTVMHHRHLVLCHAIRCGIIWQGLTHDLSKFSPAEFWISVKNYQGYRSPCANEREIKGYSAAWLHHKGRNRHHFEYWTDFSSKQHKTIPVEMPPKYLVEMFCDRMAASKTYKGKAYTDAEPLAYFEKEKDYIMMHPNTMRDLEKLLTVLKEEGEEAAFSLAKQFLRRSTM